MLVNVKPLRLVIYTPQAYALQCKAFGVNRRNINMQIRDIWQEEESTKAKPVRTKKATTQERIKEYLKEHPNATQQEVAKALNINQSTISRNMKK